MPTFRGMIADTRAGAAKSRETCERGRIRVILGRAGAEEGDDYTRQMTSQELTAVALSYGISV